MSENDDSSTVFGWFHSRVSRNLNVQHCYVQLTIHYEIPEVSLYFLAG